MKKMLIINENPHYFIGGIEAYANQLIDIFGDDFQITEIALKCSKKKTIVREINSKLFKLTKIYNKNPVYEFSSKKALNKITKEMDDYDVIINNTHYFVNKKMLNNNKVFFVQHYSSKTYGLKNLSLDLKIKYILDYIFLGLFKHENQLKKGYNVIFFTKNDNIYNRQNKRTFFIPIPYIGNNQNLIPLQKKEIDIIYLGRVEKKYKNSPFLKKISNKLKRKITVIGSANKKNLKLLNGRYIEYLGPLKHNDAIKKVNKSKILILPSKSEGFPFVLVEALSLGIPVVIFNTFKSAYFFNECDAVFMINKHKKEMFLKTIEKILSMDTEKYHKLQVKAIEFSKKFSKNKFNKNWKKILNDNLSD